MKKLLSVAMMVALGATLAGCQPEEQPKTPAVEVNVDSDAKAVEVKVPVEGEEAEAEAGKETPAAEETKVTVEEETK